VTGGGIRPTADVGLWLVTPCGIAGRYKSFGGIYCLHLQGIFKNELIVAGFTGPISKLDGDRFS
jgi:hypothetical protein